MSDWRTCPKCGHHGYQPPRYQRRGGFGSFIGEHLARCCSGCGYITREPTKDAQKSLADLLRAAPPLKGPQ